jgi:hypothetical protein
MNASAQCAVFIRQAVRPITDQAPQLFAVPTSANRSTRMQRIAQHLEPVDPGLWQRAGALKSRLTAVLVVFACVAGVLAAA